MATPQKVRFEYPVNKDYRRLPITGVIGSVTPSGLVMANLFAENHRMPASQTATVQPDGQVQVDPDPATEAVLERELLMGLMMTPETALSVAQWLTNTANAALAARSQPPQFKAN